MTLPWLFFSVVLPALAPLFCLALSLLPFQRRLLVGSRGLVRPLALFKDGQLGWVGGALCAAAILELREATTRGQGLGGHLDVAALMVFVMLLVVNAALVVGGAVFPVQVPRPDGARRWEHYAALRWSIIAYVVSAACAAVVHFSLRV